MIKRLSTLSVALLASTVVASAATTHESWTSNHQNDGKCIALASPENSEGNINGRMMPYVAVMNYPKEGIRGAVSFVSGTQETAKGDVSLSVDGQKFEVLPFNDAAFAASGAPEASLINAMRKGTNLTIRWSTEDGQTVTDTYSLAGFTAAHNDIETCRN